MLFDVSVNIDETINDYKSNQNLYPDKVYPELSWYSNNVDESNKVYGLVRSAIHQVGFDDENFGTSKWNPFKHIISEGDIVVIKPNLVLHHNFALKNASDISAVVTNATVIRPIIDYCLIALNDTGKLIIADAPHEDALFDDIIKANGLKELVNYYKKLGKNIELRDLRKFVYPTGFMDSTRQEREGDPDEYTEIDLGSQSYLHDLKNLDRLYGSDFNRSFIVEQHKNGHHKYMISNTILKADVIISMPKLKTHKKTGLSINLKNLVGINGNKNYLAHYRIGSPKQGGDEYPDSYNILEMMYRKAWDISRDIFLSKNTMATRRMNLFFVRPFMKLIRIINHILYNKEFVDKGNWFGNDTCWRMCLDLNLILRYCSKDGRLQPDVQKKYLCVVDGIIAGEGDGPMEPTPKKCGLVAIGSNPYYVDYVCASLMGFDPSRINCISKVSVNEKLISHNYQDMNVICNYNGKHLDYSSINLNFKPHKNWIGAIEKDDKKNTK